MRLQARTLAVVLAGLCCVSAAHAAVFGGGHAPIADFANGSEVATNGTLISAVNLLNDTGGVDGGAGVSTTINGVLFQSTQPGQFFEGGHSFADGSFVYHGGDGYASPDLWTSGGAYDTLADSQIFNIDNPNVNAGDGYGIINLTPGVQYELQVFMLDDRSSVSKVFPVQFQQVGWTGNFDQLDSNVTPVEIGYMTGITIGGNGTTHATGEIATVKFSIDPGYNGMLVNTWDNGAFNGMQLRSLGLLGDYNHNGTIGPEDYTVWKSSFGSTSNLAADGNGDGVVNAADYTIWRDRVAGGAGAGLKAGAVPEPTTGLMAVIAVTMMGAAAVRRQICGGK
jgi:hypothetical protein